MKVIESEQVWFFDCDDTLILWDRAGTGGATYITCPYDLSEYAVGIHGGNSQLLKEKKARGCTIVVWSQGGYKWAEAVVKHLGLEQHVDYVMSKPIGICDDLPASAWMPSPTYIPVDAKWKANGSATTNNKGDKHE